MKKFDPDKNARAHTHAYTPIHALYYVKVELTK